MLTKCPECNLPVSDKAMQCPHCGFVLNITLKNRAHRKKNKRRRLPNGFGQISEIKNRNLRKPFRAMVSVGKNKNGRPICKPLKPESYYATYNDAYAALVEYNKNAYDLDMSMTVKELYKKWASEHFKNISDSTARGIESAWEYCSSISDMKVKDIRARHIKGCIEDGSREYKGEIYLASAGTKNRIKSMFNQMLDFALEYEIIDKNYARSFKLSNEIIKEVLTPKTTHIPFTDEEIDALWEHVDDEPYVDTILVQCYSGWRPQEICTLELPNVDLKNWTFKGGLKTEAGKNRMVPIHSKIRQLVKRNYEKSKKLGNPYLFTFSSHYGQQKDTFLTYDRYKKIFRHVMTKLNLNPEHRPHDGRKHFVTMAKKYGVDEYAIKYMVGHKISDITEKIYTQREDGWLSQEIEKIK